MFDWLLASPSQRRLLGGERTRGPTTWVVAIMSFSILLIAAAGFAIANTASLLSSAIADRYSVQVRGGAGEIKAVLQAVRGAPGVTAVHAVPEQEMRHTLERWLGPAASSADLPVPALVNFDVRAGTDLRAVQQRVRSVSAGASVVAHREAVGPLLQSLRLLQWVAFGLVLLLTAAACAAVVLAARGALDTHRFTIEVMHGIGATDRQVTELFQRKIAIEALIGSVAGAAMAALVLLLLTAGASFLGDLTGGATLSGVDVVLLALLPLALTVLATWVARTAVLAALRQAL